MKPRTLIALIAVAVITLTVSTGLIAQDGSAQSDESPATTPANHPVPFINQPLVPDAVKPGGAGFTLTVNGTGFVSGSVVKWNGSARATIFVSSSKLTAHITASDIATAKTASVTVVSPGPGGGTSNASWLEVTNPSPSVTFGPSSNFGNGNTTVFVATADFNGDGKLDLAVADINNADIMVMLGKGDVTFQTAAHYALGAGPRWIAVGDFNGDGKLDLAIADGNLSILLGNGDGTFKPPVTIPGDGGIISIAVADFNRDGKLDLAAADGAAVSIFLGNGDGTFQSPVSYPLATGANAIAVGDLNRDGKLDLALALGNFDGTGAEVAVLLGNGDGSFQPAVNYPAGTGPFGITIGDFNHDGILDVASANAYVNTVSILLGNGDGTFKSHVDYPVGSFPVSITTADLTGSGDLDLITGNLYGPDGSLLLGKGDGTFQSAQEISLGSSGPYSVAVGDFNGAGRLDLVAPTYASGQAAILLQLATVVLSKTNLYFTDQLVSTSSATQTVRLSNTSGLTLKIARIAVTGTNATDFNQSNTCPSSLASSASCTITVTFTPTHIGPRSASVDITDNGVGSPQSIALSGTGVISGPNATLSPTSLTYSLQPLGTTSAAQSVTLSNYGTAALSITSVALTGTDPGDFAQTNNCDGVLAAGAICTFNITFKPAQKGPRTATLAVTDNAPGSPQTVALSGTGTAVSLNPASLNFGIHTVGTTATQSTKLTNVGSTALSITSVGITGADFDEFSQTNTCGTSVGAGKSCTITVTFKPKEPGGDSADVSISDNDITSPQQVPLSGAGCTYYRGHCTTASDLRAPALQSALIANTAAALPRPSGSSPVGSRVVDLADSTRDDPFLADGTKRELLVRFWYPADLSKGCISAEYTSPRVWNYFSKLSTLPLPEVTTNSCLEAPITEGAHPVVVFTHGYTATFTDYSFIFEDLASRGYVVASVDHTYEATAVEFPDGRFVKSVLGSHIGNTWRMDDQSMSLALAARSEDLNFVVNELERLNTAAGPFTGKLDTSRIGVMGHSLGGEATLSAIDRDDRFRAGVLIDAVQTDTSPTGTDRAILILDAGREQWSESDCRFWNQLRGPRLAVNLRGAEHVTPSDLVWLAKGAIKTGPMGTDKTIAAMRDYIAAFLDTNLQGKPLDPLLTGPSSIFPDAEVTTQKQALCGEAAAH